MQNKDELVSVCIPTYNGALYIAEAIESAIGQTYKNIEIVISDDNSSDDTIAIINKLKNKTTVPFFIYNHVPEGIGANWNYCMSKARGKFIKFLFQDDVLEPCCIEEMLTIFYQNKNAGLVASKRSFIIDENKNKNYVNMWLETFGDLQQGMSYSDDNCQVLSKGFFKNDIFLKTPINKVGEPSTFLFEKSLLKKIGWFRTDLVQILDYEFCIRVMKKKNIYIINKPLVKFRLHQKQATEANKNSETEKFKRILFNKCFFLINKQLRKELFLDYTHLGKIIYKTYKMIKK
ncbi:MAG TPA: glycosyltransferase [Bacteroidales bacterium]|nr:glycosyltransferase [Bacteroidales bacterium]